MPNHLLILVTALLCATPALAEDATTAHAEYRRSPFDRTFGLATYATGWSGAYGGAGVGGRLRVEPWRFLGVDLFSEHLLVTSPTGLRHDHPIGFHLYTPVRLSEVVQLRPLLGMCVVFSAIEPEQRHAPRADDVLVGAHLGAGLDLSLHSRLSFFAEAKAVAWMGHDRSVQGWTGAVGNQVQPFLVAQAQLGFTVHLGER